MAGFQEFFDPSNKIRIDHFFYNQFRETAGKRLYLLLSNVFI